LEHNFFSLGNFPHVGLSENGNFLTPANILNTRRCWYFFAYVACVALGRNWKVETRLNCAWLASSRRCCLL